MSVVVSRREALAAAAGAVAIPALVSRAIAAPESAAEPFGYCLNTSTIRGKMLPIVEVLEIAAKAGYKGIEPWVREIDLYTAAGGSLSDLRKRIADLGLSVASVIGFAEWIVDDDAKRTKGLEEARRTMDVTAQIGGTRLAAPPAGATKETLDLDRVTERYRALLQVGDSLGVVPQLEVWGFSQTLRRLSECVYVAIESGHPKACVLPDVYHLHKGGSGFEGLKLVSGSAIHVVHMNDFPAQPPRDQITDAHRVYPGEGVAPLAQILRDLRTAGFRGMLSLELFNRGYWEQDPLAVALTGIEKMRAAVVRM
jgi:sugar phosphate isomerase/epimerase